MELLHPTKGASITDTKYENSCEYHITYPFLPMVRIYHLEHPHFRFFRDVKSL